MHTRQRVAAHPHSEHTSLTVTEIPFRPPVLPSCQPCCSGEIPDAVWTAIITVLRLHGPMKRLTFSVHVGALMASQGWRFCKCYRHQLTAAHAAVYALLDPVQANYAADDICGKAGL